MSYPPPQGSGATEYVHATIAVENLDSPVIQKEVRTAVEAQPGVEDVNIAEGKLFICYDPLQTSQREIESAIERAGKHPTEGTAERSSLYTEPS